MPPRSPTQAFDPTPALEHNPDNFSPLNGEATSMWKPGGDNRTVHFENTPVAIPTRHSIATTHVPLLPPIPSASSVPKQAFAVHAPQSGIDITAYIENCRNLNEQLRQAHETERKAWNIERSALQARIAELESKASRIRDPKRRSSNDSSAASALSFRSDFRNGWDFSRQTTSMRSSSINGESTSHSAPPVWQGPETTPPVTRVFSHDDSDVSHLPSISEDAEPFPNLSREISPSTKEESHPIDVSALDSTLEGITLKSTGPAVTSTFMTKITSPQFGSPSHTPSPVPNHRPPSNTLINPSKSLSLDTNSLLDPLDKKLKLHAGHTPMAMDGTFSVSDIPTEQPSPKRDYPPEPAPTKGAPSRPAENSSSYFSLDDHVAKAEKTDEAVDDEHEVELSFETQDDPPMKAPLMLDPSARSQAANSFLDKVDAKLSEVAAQSRLRSDTTTTADSEEPPAVPPVDEPGHGHVKNKASLDDMPKLRIKKSTNFGSAWGGDMPGCR